MSNINSKHALANTKNIYAHINKSIRVPICTHIPLCTQTRIYTTRVHGYIFAPECVCCIKSFTVKQRKYSINISIKSLAIRNQHYTNLIVKTWQNVKTNKTDMQIYTWDGKCATATELLLLIVSGAVVLPAPRTVSNICCSVKYKWNQVFQLEFILVQTGWRIACDPSGISNIWTTFFAMLIQNI